MSMSENGTFNTTKKTASFDVGNGKKEKGTYKLIGNKLSLTLNGATIAYEKDSSSKKTPKKVTSSSRKTTASKTSTSIKKKAKKTYELESDGSFLGLELGEYEVGQDIAPDTYSASFNYETEDGDMTDGSGTITIDRADGSHKKYTITADDTGYADDALRIIPKNGDRITFESDGTSSTFDLSEPI